MSDAELIDRLADALANRIKPAFPLDIELWNAERVADYFDKTVAVAHRSILSKPTFPRAIKTAKGARPLYFAKEVVQWAIACKEKY